MLWMAYLFHDSNTSEDQIMQAVDAVINEVRKDGVSVEQLDRARVKLRSDFYEAVDSGFGRADLLASFALFDDRPQRINELEQHFTSLTPELVKKTADKYLRPTNRPVLAVDPGKAA